jgi:succinate dehydrogenase hydrophobic anchor subunit
MNTFWTFLILSENSEHILNILSIVWTDYEHSLNSLNILKKVYTDYVMDG